MKITEKRVAYADTIKRLFDNMGWFNLNEKKAVMVSSALEFVGTENGITAERLYYAALYVEQYTDPGALEGLDTADIMAIISRKCWYTYEIQGD